MRRDEIFAKINEARDRADEKHGPSTIPMVANQNPYFVNAILGEEVGEVARALLERDAQNLRDELVDVLQVCTAWLEAL